MGADYSDLRGARILVVGATSCIGAVLSNVLSAQGAELFLAGRDQDKLSSMMLGHGSVHARIGLDLEGDLGLAELSRSIPSLNGIVFCTGVMDPFPAKCLFQRNDDPNVPVNFLSVVKMMSFLFHRRLLEDGASVVFLSSISSSFAYSGSAMYSSSKAALEAYSRSLALELSSRRIRSNCIKAGLIESPMFESAKKMISQKDLSRTYDRYPLGVGSPDDISQATLFLLSNASRWITGQALVVDGGVTASLG